MKNGGKISALLLCAALMVTIGGCGLVGTAFGTAEGHNGELVLRADRDGDEFVLSVQKSKESAGVGALALTQLIDDMNERQSLAPDAVSGATQTSQAAVDAAVTAVGALGFDTDELRARVRFNEIEDREYTCDVLVIGAGGAGLTAAIAAAQKGADVIVLEKMGVAGGSTARSDGKVLASGTSIQRDKLISDSSSGLGSFLFAYATDDADSTRVLDMAQHTASNLDLLTKYGVRFSDTLLASYPGQEPARVHLVCNADGATGGGYLIEPLVRAANAYGVRILYEAQATELLSTASLTVTGARARERGGSILTVHAGATILATGGYDRNAALFKTLANADTDMALSLTATGNTGDGVLLARSVGGATVGGVPIAVLNDYYGGTDGACGLLVTPSGERFCNEAAQAFEVSGKLFAGGYGMAYYITDAGGYSGRFKDAVESGYIHKADTLEALGAAIGARNLPATVEQYNKLCEDGADTRFGKDAKYLKAVDKGPFYAVPYIPTVYGTTGGLLTNISCAVITADGDAVEGLYAAGELVNGVFFDAEFPGFGASLAEAIETGRIAGERAAVYVEMEKGKQAAQQREDEAREEAPIEEAKYTTGYLY